MLDLRGGPFCGERTEDTGLYCYAIGCARRLTPGGLAVVKLSRSSPRQIMGVTEQHLYRKTTRGLDTWYGWIMELDTDGG